MGSSALKSALFFSISMAMLVCGNCQKTTLSGLVYEMPKILSLLKNVNHTSATVASFLPHLESLLKNQEMKTSIGTANEVAYELQGQPGIEEILKDHLHKREQTVKLLHTQHNETMTVLHTMADTLHQVVSALQFQSQKLEDMTSALYSCVGGLEGQDEQGSTPEIFTTDEPSATQGCDTALGMEDGRILDSQLTASSYFSWYDPYSDYEAHYTASKGRLNFPQDGWATHMEDQNQWIQVTFNRVHLITGIITEGYTDAWVTAYKVQYSEDGRIYRYVIKAGGHEKVFDANTDDHTHVTNNLQVKAKGIRIRVHDWRRWIHMRFELLGCPL